MMISEQLVHLVGLLVAALLAYVGLSQKNASGKLVRLIDKIDARIAKHEATDEIIHKGIEQRIGALERKAET